MDKAITYRFRCTTEGVDKFVTVPDDGPIPTKCPDDTSHTIDSNSMVEFDTLEKEMRKNQTILTQDGKTRRPKGYRFTATKNSTSVHYFLIDENISLRGGSLEMENHVFGDYYSFDIEDKDGNVYPAGTIVTEYIDKQNIRKSGLNELEDESISDPIPANVFYIKLTYVSVGTVDDPKGALDLTAYL